MRLTHKSQRVIIARSLLHHLALILLIFMVSACTSIRQANIPVRLGVHSEYQLQSVPLKLQGLATLQQLIVTTSTEQHQLLLQIELYQEQINMVGLSPAGLVLFELSWAKGAGLKLSSKVPLKGLQPEAMLAYYQLSNWPAKDIHRGLVGMQMKISSEAGEIREFYQAGKLVFSVEHQAHSTKLVHQQDHYQIDIVTLERNQIE